MSVPEQLSNVAHSEVCRRFQSAWWNRQAQPIESFLPAEDHPNYLSTLEELVLLELELAYQFPAQLCPESGGEPVRERRRIEVYLARFPRLNEPAIVQRLVAEEFLIRQRCGDRPSVEEYRARFPTVVLPILVETPTQPSNSRAAAELPTIPGYEILGILGRGGMGVVYQARQLSLDRLVALKMIVAGAAADAEELTRFRLEAEAVARVPHANIIQIHEVGQSQGSPYFALEYVAGGSLAQKLARQPQPPREAARLVGTLARAMHHAHERGILHRDLKPANVLLTTDGTPKITDFGLAKKLNSESGTVASGVTQTGAILGTPSYMAPEQAQGAVNDIGPMADVYALGAILYECLTGRPPFKGQTVIETLDQVRTMEPGPPSRLQPQVPRDLETICLKCLRKQPHERYASAAELAEDLRRFLHDEPIQARPVRVWERGLKWARRRPTWAALVTLGPLLLLLAAGLALWYWDAYQRVKVEYYANFVKRWGVPEGIGRVTEEQLGRRFVTYKFYRRGGRVEKVEAVNGHGFLTTQHNVPVFIGDLPASGDSGMNARHECRWEYKRNQQGQATDEVASDQKGNVIWTFHYTKPPTRGYFADERGYPSPRSGSGAAFVELTFSPEGFEKEIHYLDRDDKPRADRYGYFGERRQLDPRGLPEQTTYLGSPNQSGAYGGSLKSTWVYDEQGKLKELAYFDLDGKPTLTTDGYAKVTYAYDDWGNTKTVAYFGKEGQPISNNEGIATEIRRYDERGNRIEEAFFGPDDKPVLNRDLVARFTADYDERGYLKRADWFGEDGKPTLHKNGFATLVMVNDDRGNPKDVSMFGTDGKPTLQKDGYARITKEYDARGNIRESATYGLDGKLILDKEGRARTVSEYDGQGRLKKSFYYGTDGQPVLFRQSYAWFEREYDERGNIKETTLYGVDGKLAVHRDGYSRWTAGYDEYGNQNEMAYFGPDGKPTLRKEGYARWTAKYDANRKATELAYFGLDNKPTLHPDGYARSTVEYDERGNPFKESYFGTDGQPTLHKDGYASRTMKYDPHGNREEENYFGLDGKPIRHKDGYAGFTARYDEKNNQVDATYFDTEGKLLRVKVIVVEVVPDSRAERLGLKPDDILAKYDNQEVVNMWRFIAKRRGEGEEHKSVELHILRNGQPMRFHVEPGMLGVTLEDRASP